MITLYKWDGLDWMDLRMDGWDAESTNLVAAAKRLHQSLCNSALHGALVVLLEMFSTSDHALQMSWTKRRNEK